MAKITPVVNSPARNLFAFARGPSVFLCAVFAASGVAQAAPPPTKGALYRDGQSSRYLLGGAWLYRADPGNVGVAQRWWRSARGWSPIAVPNAFNSGDFSGGSMDGSVAWYRRDFTLSADAFSRYLPSESVPASVRAADQHKQSDATKATDGSIRPDENAASENM